MPPGINNDLHAGDKGRVEHQVQSRQSQQRHDQRQRRVNRIAAGDDHDAAGHSRPDSR